MSALIPLVAIPAGVAIAAAADGGTPATTPAPSKTTTAGGIQIRRPPSGSSINIASRGSVIGATSLRNFQQQIAAARDGRLSWGAVVPARSTSPAIGDTTTNYSQTVDPALQQKLAEIESYAKAAYNNMDDAARKKGAAAANELLKLDPPLTGKESWEDMSKAIGAAAGAAALGWIPGGQVIGPIVGAWLGAKLEDLVSKNIDEIKDWFKGRWSDIEGWVTGAYGEAKEVVNDVVDYIGGWF